MNGDDSKNNTRSDNFTMSIKAVNTEVDTSANRVQDEALENQESFMPIVTEPMLADDEQNASHQIIDKNDQETVVPIMPLV
ncbi:hypothetical protein [Moraxella oculi]|uniref:Uncharacterized protein n=1 Tax=Moraxella oculi TaxID=2940516 RepID=A0ABW8U5B6_9GAMM